jgi:hypothetical protein
VLFPLGELDDDDEDEDDVRTYLGWAGRHPPLGSAAHPGAAAVPAPPPLRSPAPTHVPHPTGPRWPSPIGEPDARPVTGDRARLHFLLQFHFLPSSTTMGTKSERARWTAAGTGTGPRYRVCVGCLFSFAVLRLLDWGCTFAFSSRSRSRWHASRPPFTAGSAAVSLSPRWRCCVSRGWWTGLAHPRALARRRFISSLTISASGTRLALGTCESTGSIRPPGPSFSPSYIRMHPGSTRCPSAYHISIAIDLLFTDNLNHRRSKTTMGAFPSSSGNSALM